MENNTKNTVVKLTDEYEVVIDPYNYTLYQYQTTKDNKLYKKTIGYYCDMKAVLIALKRLKVSQLQGVYSIDDYIKELSELENWTSKMDTGRI